MQNIFKCLSEGDSLFSYNYIVTSAPTMLQSVKEKNSPSAKLLPEHTEFAPSLDVGARCPSQPQILTFLSLGSILLYNGKRSSNAVCSLKYHAIWYLTSKMPPQGPDRWNRYPPEETHRWNLLAICFQREERTGCWEEQPSDSNNLTA